MVELSDFRGARPIPASLDKGIVATKELRPALTPIAARPTAATRLVVENRQAFANEPLALGVGLLGAIGGESVFFNGLVRGTHFSAGDPFGSTGWQLKASELGKVYAYAPNSFVGAMNAQIELRSADNARLDTQFGRLEWIPKLPPSRPVSEKTFDPGDTAQPEQAAQRPDAERLSRLVKRGLELLKDGDIAAARLALRPAADAGDAQAALMLGATFDPLVLAELRVFGLAGDPTAARAWYQKAMELGSAEAARRIERLAQTDK